MSQMLAEIHAGQVLGTIIYSIIGIIVFIVAYAIIEKITPYSINKEIAKDQNVALGIIIGSVIIGLAIIIAAAIH